MKTTILATFLLILPNFAYAGEVLDVPVEVDLEVRSAIGNLKSARFSNNDVERIGCGVRAIVFNDTLFSFGFCQARTADEVQAFCTTENEDLIKSIRGISDYSFLTFNWDENDECTRIGYSTQSQYIPSKKDK